MTNYQEIKELNNLLQALNELNEDLFIAQSHRYELDKTVDELTNKKLIAKVNSLAENLNKHIFTVNHELDTLTRQITKRIETLKK